MAEQANDEGLGRDDPVAGDPRLRRFQPLVDGIQRSQFVREWLDTELSASQPDPDGRAEHGRGGEPASVPPTQPDASFIDVALSSQKSASTSSSRHPVPGQYVVGSGESADIKLPADAGVGGRHGCLLCEVGSLMFLEYPGGTNNDQGCLTVLRHGDSVRVGNLVMTVHDCRAETPAQTACPEPGNHPSHDDDLIRSLDLREYEAVSKIGRGGNGAVFKATQLGTNRPVAIKTMLPQLLNREKARQVFFREASIASQLNHPQIVSCLGFGVSNDIPYLIMEYVPTVPLNQLLRGSSDVRRVRLSVGIAVKTLCGLAYAHDRQIVHRDIKPSNILAYKLDGRLHLKISDFGLAKFTATSGYSGITDTGDVCGTLAYMSPEQLRSSRDAGPDADLYSVLVCLYEFLTGRLPHQGSTTAALIKSKLTDAPPPAQDLNPSVGLELSGVLERGLSPNAGKRFTSARELADTLSCFRERS